MFMNDKKFAKECRVFKHPQIYKDVIDVFIFANDNAKFGEGQYSMYIVCLNGVLLYEGIDKRDSASIKMTPLKGDNDNDLLHCQIQAGSIDCNPVGKILFDVKLMNDQYKLKSFLKDKSQAKYDFVQQGKGPKKMLRFFNNYVIEVKTDKKIGDKV
jgi:hypothetical protein